MNAIRVRVCIENQKSVCVCVFICMTGSYLWISHVVRFCNFRSEIVMLNIRVKSTNKIEL